MAALLDRGTQLMDRGKLAEAIAAYREVTTLAPGFGPAYRNPALALERDSRPGEALSASGRAVELQSDDLEAHLIMSRLLLKLERTEQAVAMYELAALAAPARSDIQASLAAALARQGVWKRRARRARRRSTSLRKMPAPGSISGLSAAEETISKARLRRTERPSASIRTRPKPTPISASR